MLASRMRLVSRTYITKSVLPLTDYYLANTRTGSYWYMYQHAVFVKYRMLLQKKAVQTTKLKGARRKKTHRPKPEEQACHRIITAPQCVTKIRTQSTMKSSA
jgi:hypothetical protein